MTPPALFAVMVHERAPLRGADVPGMLLAWLQEAGGFAAIGLTFWLIAYLAQPGITAAEEKWPRWKKALFIAFAAIAGLGYLTFALSSFRSPTPATRDTLLAIAGGAALLAVGLPFVCDLWQVRFRRIAALASLSFWEAVRNKVLFILLLLLPIFLFGDWYMTHQPQNQLRTTIEVEYTAMTVLLLVTAVILAAFGIPNDIRHQSIHTVITKPVQRFEIVVGRILGYVALMSVMLVGLAGASLLYVAVPGRIHPAAVQETWRARVPLEGELSFRGPIPELAGIKGLEDWNYRSWIPGALGAEGVWAFAELPGQLDRRAFVPCEFSFQIRHTKAGKEDKGVPCVLTFATWRWSPARLGEYNAARDRMLAEEARKPRPAPRAEIDDRLAEKFGYWQDAGKEVFNDQIYTVDVPAGLFKNARGADAARQRELQERAQQTREPGPPPVEVSVTCAQPMVFLGMAKHDLYLVDAEGFFALNFFKGALGIWFRVCLLIGLAVACSTYLSGVVSLICALFLFGTGMARQFIQNVAANAVEGGGPAEQFLRLLQRQNVTTRLEPAPTTQAAGAFDESFRWFLGRFLSLIPDVDRFDLSSYVAEGFDISWTTLTLCLILLVGYLLPWIVLAHYLIKSREVAA